MHLLMSVVEDGTVAGPGLSAIETIVTFLIIPVVMFVVISIISWFGSAPRKEKTNSSITSIN